MTARQKPCRGCGGGIITAQAPNGGRVPLDPYPDPAGRYRVDVLDRGLLILRDGEPASSRTRRYERHQCVTAAKATPRRCGPRPEQLALGDQP